MRRLVKRDLDLIRDLLRAINDLEPEDAVASPWKQLQISNRTYSEIRYHTRMLLERRFLYEEAVILDALGASSDVVVKTRPDAITDSGHDFLDSVRDPEIWAKTKKGAAAAGGFTIDLLKDLALGFVKKQIEERTGVKL
jgi:hypothetical protein